MLLDAARQESQPEPASSGDERGAAQTVRADSPMPRTVGAAPKTTDASAAKSDTVKSDTVKSDAVKAGPAATARADGAAQDDAAEADDEPKTDERKADEAETDLQAAVLAAASGVAPADPSATAPATPSDPANAANPATSVPAVAIVLPVNPDPVPVGVPPASELDTGAPKPARLAAAALLQAGMPESDAAPSDQPAAAPSPAGEPNAPAQAGSVELPAEIAWQADAALAQAGAAPAPPGAASAQPSTASAPTAPAASHQEAAPAPTTATPLQPDTTAPAVAPTTVAAAQAPAPGVPVGDTGAPTNPAGAAPASPAPSPDSSPSAPAIVTAAGAATVAPPSPDRRPAAAAPNLDRQAAPKGSDEANAASDADAVPQGRMPLGRPIQAANSAESAPPTVRQTGAVSDTSGSPHPDPSGAPPAAPTAAIPTPPSGAAKEPEGDAKASGAHLRAVHDGPEMLEMQAGAGDPRPAAIPSLPPGHTAAAADPAQPLAIAAAGTDAANPGAPANAAYASASAALVPVSGLAVEIVARAQEGKNRFEIRLDPPELGRIDVHLHVDRDGNVTSRLVVERSETLDLLRRDAPSLERALQDAGLKTGQQGLEFSLRDQPSGREHSARNDSGASRLIVPDDLAPPAAAAIGYGRRLGMGTGVDIRV